MDGLFGTIRNLGAGRVAGLGAILLGAIGFFAYIMLRMSTPDMALLYSGLSPDDAGHIVAQLEQHGIAYELKADGTQIFVPAPQVPNVRVQLAEQGLPKGDTVGYEIFDKPDTFGTSSFVRDINRLRALEGELSRTIRSIDGIKMARVHLVEPRRELFSRDRQEPSASIVLGLAGNMRLTQGQVAAIEHLVASAVPGLKTSRVSIIDDHGTLLARGGGDGSDALLAASSEDERRRAYEDQIRRKILEMLEPIVGADRVRAEVTADMDFDRESTTSEIYDPNQQVARSTQTVEEKSTSTEGKVNPPVSVTSNIPAAASTQPGAAATPAQGTQTGVPPVPQQPAQTESGGHASSSTNSRTEETTNYEISKTVKNFTRDIGTLKRLSVAVMVDGSYAADGSGKQTYHPRSQAELDQLAAMVRSAVGYNAQRGDKLELINMRFAAPDELTASGGQSSSFLAQFSSAQLFRLAEIAVLALVAILVMLLVIRPLIRRLFEVGPAAADGAAGGQRQAMLANHSPGEQPALTASPAAAAAGAEEVNADAMIDIGRVEGRVRHSSVKKVGQIIEKHPEEAVSILRNWLVQNG